MNIQDTKCNSRIGTQNDKIRSKEEGVIRYSILIDAIVTNLQKVILSVMICIITELTNKVKLSFGEPNSNICFCCIFQIR